MLLVLILYNMLIIDRVSFLSIQSKMFLLSWRSIFIIPINTICYGCLWSKGFRFIFFPCCFFFLVLKTSTCMTPVYICYRLEYWNLPVRSDFKCIACRSKLKKKRNQMPIVSLKYVCMCHKKKLHGFHYETKKTRCCERLK